MTTRFTFLFALISFFGQAQDSIPFSLKSLDEKMYYDTSIVICYYDNFEYNSMDFYFKYKNRCTYDGNGNLVLVETYSIDDIPDRATFNIYNSDNRLIQSTIHPWDNIASDWSSNHTAITSYTYNTNLDILTKEKISYYPNQNIQGNRYDYSYDSNFNLIKEKYSLLDSNGTSWNRYETKDFTFDSNNNLISRIDSLFDSNDSTWSEKSYTLSYNNNNLTSIERVFNGIQTKTVLGYDLNNNCTTILNLIKDINNIWVYYQSSYTTADYYYQNQYYFLPKYEKFYDANNNLIHEIRYKYIDSTNTFEIQDESEFQYDNNNRVIEEIYHNPNADPTMYPSYKYWKDQYTYNANGQLTLWHTYYQDEQTLSWNDWSKEIYEYDPNGNEIFYERIYPASINNELMWIPCCRRELCDLILSMDEIIEPEVLIAPNPTNNFITIKELPLKSTIEVFDITGKKLLSELTYQSSKRINLNELGKSGIYLVLITGENESFQVTKKIILTE